MCNAAAVKTQHTISWSTLFSISRRTILWNHNRKSSMNTVDTTLITQSFPHYVEYEVLNVSHGRAFIWQAAECVLHASISTSAKKCTGLHPNSHKDGKQDCSTPCSLRNHQSLISVLRIWRFHIQHRIVTELAKQEPHIPCATDWWSWPLALHKSIPHPRFSHSTAASYRFPGILM